MVHHKLVALFFFVFRPIHMSERGIQSTSEARTEAIQPLSWLGEDRSLSNSWLFGLRRGPGFGPLAQAQGRYLELERQVPGIDLGPF